MKRWTRWMVGLLLCGVLGTMSGCASQQPSEALPTTEAPIGYQDINLGNQLVFSLRDPFVEVERSTSSFTFQAEKQAVGSVFCGKLEEEGADLESLEQECLKSITDVGYTISNEEWSENGGYHVVTCDVTTSRKIYNRFVAYFKEEEGFYCGIEIFYASDTYGNIAPAVDTLVQSARLVQSNHEQFANLDRQVSIYIPYYYSVERTGSSLRIAYQDVCYAEYSIEQSEVLDTNTQARRIELLADESASEIQLQEGIEIASEQYQYVMNQFAYAIDGHTYQESYVSTPLASGDTLSVHIVSIDAEADFSKLLDIVPFQADTSLHNEATTNE